MANRDQEPNIVRSLGHRLVEQDLEPTEPSAESIAEMPEIDLSRHRRVPGRGHHARLRGSSLVVLVMAAVITSPVAACTKNKVNASSPDVPATPDDILSASTPYIPIEPVSFIDQFRNFPNVPKCRDLDGSSSCNSAKEYIENFPNNATQVIMFQLDGNVDSTNPFVGVSSRNSLYRVIVDYVRFRTDLVGDCVYRSGLGIRLRAELKTFKANLDISSPVSIGVNAELGKLSGSLRFETIGISGKTVTMLVPIPSQISTESIQKALEAAASVKASLYAEDVVLEPQVFSYKCPRPEDVSEFIEPEEEEGGDSSGSQAGAPSTPASEASPNKEKPAMAPAEDDTIHE